MVNLSRLNLMDAAVPVTLQDMDVVLCRNVLMYFSSAGVNSVLDKLWDCLIPGGWLVATPSESGLLSSHGRFEPVNVGGVLLYRKMKIMSRNAEWALTGSNSGMILMLLCLRLQNSLILMPNWSLLRLILSIYCF